MRRRSVILGLLAVAATGSVRAEQNRKAHRVAYVSLAIPPGFFTKNDPPLPPVKVVPDPRSFRLSYAYVLIH